MSEVSTSRHIFAPYCTGKLGIDMGFGGDALLKEPSCLTLDMVGGSYTNVGSDKQVLRGHCGDLAGFCDESLDYLTSCHLLEDFSYVLLLQFITEWRRVLKIGGLILTNCPNQQRFLAHCNATGQPKNDAHLEPDFSLQTWNANVVSKTGPWEVVYEEDNFGAYSWLQILRKL